MSLSQEEIRLLDLIEQDYLLTRTIPSQEVCFEKYGIARGDYTRALKKQEFKDQLSERGVEIREVVSAGPINLTPQQYAVINAVLDTTDNRSIKKKLEHYKVSTQKWEAWLRDPAVQHYLRTRTEGALEDNQFHAHLALIDRVKEGDLGSIRYYNAMTGRFVENAGQNVDLQLVLTRILEIVMKYVDDPVKLEAMGSELAALGQAAGVTKAITAPVRLAL